MVSSDGIGGAAAPEKLGGFSTTHQRSRRDPNLKCDEMMKLIFWRDTSLTRLWQNNAKHRDGTCAAFERGYSHQSAEKNREKQQNVTRLYKSETA